MKFGMNLYLWTTDFTSPHLTLLRLLKAAGYDGVEVPVARGNASNYSDIAKCLTDEGLLCTTITNLGAAENPVSPDARVRRAGLDSLKWAIETSQLLGSGMLAGPLYAAYGVFTGLGPIERELHWPADVMRAAADLARPAGIGLSIEFLNRFETYLLNTVAHSRDFVDLVDRPNFGILYDTHHAHHEENDLAAAIARAGPRITHVHFSESQRGALGSGLVDWPTNVASLTEAGYDGWVMVEAFSKDVPGLARAAHVWRDTFSSPEEVYRGGIGFLRRHFEHGA